jgi:hypothetical protein
METGKSELSTALLLGGFVKAEITSDETTRTAVAFKPSGPISVALPLRKKAKEAEPAAPATVESVWKVMATSSSEELGIDLVDPDSLLNEDDLNAGGKESECGAIRVAGAGKKRRACKDCSCGFAEEILKDENATESHHDDHDHKTGGCGACAKGDAFRCATCPYRGLPTFTPGSKPAVKLNVDGTRSLVLDVESDVVF